MRRKRRENLAMFLEFVIPLLGIGEPLRRDRYLLALCFALEQLALGHRRRQIVALPPRHLKSIMAVVLSAWMLGRDPTTKILAVCYGAELGEKQTRLFRKIIESPRFAQLFPRFEIKRNSMEELETSMGGFRKSVTPGGAATGFGADLIIIDDLLKAGEAYSDVQREAANSFFDTTLYQRLNNKVKGSVLVIAQRLHEFDIIGHLQTKCEWDEFICPAIAVEDQSFPSYYGATWTRKTGDLLSSLYTHDDLREIRRMSGEWIWSTQHQQNPVPPGGYCVERHWFKEYDEVCDRDQYEYVIQSYDTATSNDPKACFSVCLTFGYVDNCWWLLDVYRRQVNLPDLRDAALRLYRRWQPDRVLIEDASSGRQLFQLLHDRLDIGRDVLRACRPFGSKEERLSLEAHKIEQGLIALPVSAPWLARFEAEVLGFPHTGYNDQVDALTQFLRWVDGRSGRAMLNIDPVTGRRKAGTRPTGSLHRRRQRLMRHAA